MNRFLFFVFFFLFKLFGFDLYQFYHLVLNYSDVQMQWFTKRPSKPKPLLLLLIPDFALCIYLSL